MSMRSALRKFEHHRAEAAAWQAEADQAYFCDDLQAEAEMFQGFADAEEERAEAYLEEIQSRAIFPPVVVRRVLRA